MSANEELEYVVCDYCGGDETEKVAQQTDLLHHTTEEIFIIVKCVACGLHYTNPRPSPAEIGRYYAETYSYHVAPSAIRSLAYRLAGCVANNELLAFFAGLIPDIGHRLVPFVKPTIADPVRIYQQQGGRGTMLDIGCGSGANANFWGTKASLLSYRKSMNVVGVEVNNRARLLLIAKGVEVFAEIEDIVKSRLFGVIRMNWSLEHVHSPARYFEFISNHLEKDGRAIIAVPNYQGLLYQLAPNCVELPIHLYHFRAEDIKNYAKRYGLRVRESHTFSYPGMFSTGAQAGMFSDAFTRRFSLREARQFQSALARFDRAGWGNDMVAVISRE
jgi:SAM-dependent methyltransferase